MYVPSSLSVARARTTLEPRTSMRNWSPPLVTRSSAASNASIVKEAACLAIAVSRPLPLALLVDATARGATPRVRLVDIFLAEGFSSPSSSSGDPRVGES